LNHDSLPAKTFTGLQIELKTSGSSTEPNRGAIAFIAFAHGPMANGDVLKIERKHASHGYILTGEALEGAKGIFDAERLVHDG
jgi:hypothetical protein